MEPQHYVPILKAKMGELKAYEESTAAVRGALTPVWEVPSVDWDWDKDVPKKTLDAHLDAVATKISGVMGQAEAFVDVQLLEDALLPNGEHPLIYVCRAMRNAGTNAIPVVHVPVSAPELAAGIAAVGTFGRRVMLRIAPELFGDTPAVATATISDVLAKLGLGIASADILLDWGPIEGQPSGVLGLAIRGVLNAHPLILGGKSLVLAASAFPPDLTRIPANSISPVPRTEWDVWLNLYNNRAGLTRLPSFADYGIAHPDTNDLDPRIIRMSAQLRYTMRKEWAVAKGRSVRTAGFAQIVTLAAAISTDPDFSGAAFSEGDRHIEALASGTTPPGNGMTWRKIGTNHHLAFVVSELARLSWP